MKVGEQIRTLRGEHGFSQEELAERVYVSRQSISNWENGKTYPDLKSLLLLSEVFSVSLDTLIKGDVETMKVEVNAQEVAEFRKYSVVYTLMLLVMMIVPIPLGYFLGWWGLAVYALLSAVVLWWAFRLERLKKAHDVHTYKEILAFMEGKSLDKTDKAREEGKRPYQQILLAVGTAVVAFVVCALMGWIFTTFF